MTSNTTNENLRFEYLDGIRGVAALIVVINHFRNAFYDAKASSIVYSFAWDSLNFIFLTGHFCVQLFFVLSGFVLAYNSFYRKNFLNKQLSKRFIRLVLPVFLSSVIYMLFSNYKLFFFDELIKINFTNWASSHWVVNYSIIKFLKRFIFDFMIFSDWQFIMNINSSLWTIPIELYWSYILFIIFWLINKIQNIFLKNLILIVGVTICILCLTFIGEDFGFLFLGGSLFALNYSKVVIWRNNKYMNLFLFLMTLIFVYLIENNWILIIPSEYINWGTILCLIYIFISIRSNIIHKFFSYPIFKWLGRISFSLYLLHILIIGSISSKLYIIFSYFRNDFGLLLLLLFTLITSSIIAHIFTVYIDEPLMKHFDKLYNKINNAISKK